jgi:hypothetical protein
MNTKRWILVVVMLLCIPTALPVVGQLGDGYDLTWNSIDGGGTMFSMGGYSLGGTIGQPDAGTLSGASYTLAGGFWVGGSNGYKVYLPLIVK